MQQRSKLVLDLVLLHVDMFRIRVEGAAGEGVEGGAAVDGSLCLALVARLIPARRSPPNGPDDRRRLEGGKHVMAGEIPPATPRPIPESPGRSGPVTEYGFPRGVSDHRAASRHPKADKVTRNPTRIIRSAKRSM
ncbi:hypothetical protein ASF32_01390 [Methylobacterium sp. Leaf91]|nr:hypothetical protein ASF24_08565 [Methylobacterium sp. Leaf86]KQP00566.1 hypothetical protein ASF32_01390 [Methylobacterium sp. Leaf91]